MLAAVAALEPSSASVPLPALEIASARSSVPVDPGSLAPTIDWGEALDVGTFYGRTEELETLNQWLVLDRCRLIAILGLGGMGKSSLAAKITQQVQGDFEAIIWRSLRNAPTLETLLAELVPFVSQQQETQATPNACWRGCGSGDA